MIEVYERFASFASFVGGEARHLLDEKILEHEVPWTDGLSHLSKNGGQIPRDHELTTAIKSIADEVNSPKRRLSNTQILRIIELKSTSR